MVKTVFDELEEELSRGGVAGLLDALAAQMRRESRFHELFEALKMKLRLRLGLPLLNLDAADEPSEEIGKQLEDGLIAACREVGTLLLQNGRIREGWMYMRPVGDRPAVVRILSQLEIEDDLLDEMVEVCLHEGVDPERGYGLVLKHYGTCNSITTYETATQQLRKEDRQKCARLLLRHVHAELKTSVIADIARQEGVTPPEPTLRELVADRDWLFAGNSYHIDTTHLAATVRFSRILDDAPSLRLALDLTEYGRRLNPQFQYQGEEPFVDIYPSHALLFQAMLGENTDAAIAFFKARAEAVDATHHGPAAIEVYVDLLSRVGRADEALAAAIALTPERTRSIGHAPSMLELAQKSGRFEPLLAYCRQHDDLLGYGTALAHRGLAKSSAGTR